MAHPEGLGKDEVGSEALGGPIHDAIFPQCWDEVEEKRSSEIQLHPFLICTLEVLNQGLQHTSPLVTHFAREQRTSRLQLTKHKLRQ
jgi:hypothetical protein